MRLFRNDLKKITELRNSGFKNEKIIQNIIENNLGSVFKDLQFLKSEPRTGDLRFDTVAFDIKKNCFVIIEYKNVKNKWILEQGMTYINALKNKKDFFRILYFEKHNKYSKKSFNWNQSYVIFISTEFTKLHLETSKDQPIQLYRIYYYDKKMFLLEKVVDNVSKSVGSELKKKKHKVEIEYSEEEYLDRVSSDITRKLYFDIKAHLKDEFKGVNPHINKHYIGFHNVSNSCIFSLVIQKSNIKLFYNTKITDKIISKSNFIEDVSKIGKWCVGDYRSAIEDLDDFSKALHYIKKIDQKES